MSKQDPTLLQAIIKFLQAMPVVRESNPAERERWLTTAGLAHYIDEAELRDANQPETFVRWSMVALWEQPRDLMRWLEYLATSKANPGPEADKLLHFIAQIRVERMERQVTIGEFLRRQGLRIEAGMPDLFARKAEQHDDLRQQTYISNAANILDHPRNGQHSANGAARPTSYSLNDLRDLFSLNTFFVFGSPGMSKTSVRMELTRISRRSSQSRRTPMLILDVDMERVVGLTRRSPTEIRDAVVKDTLQALNTELKSRAEQLARLLAEPDAVARLAVLRNRFALDFWDCAPLKPIPMLYEQHDTRIVGWRRRNTPLEEWLGELWAIVQAAGFVTVSLIVDRVDDSTTPPTLPPDQLMAHITRCLEPLLHKPLLTQQGMPVAWKFFLNEELYPVVQQRVGANTPVRYLFLHPWSPQDLIRLIDRRLSYFERSGNRGSNAGKALSDLCLSEVDEALLVAFATLANGSPREFIMLVEQLLGRHCAQARGPEERISRATIQAMIDERHRLPAPAPLSPPPPAPAPLEQELAQALAPDYLSRYERALDKLAALLPANQVILADFLAQEGRMRQNIARARRAESRDNDAERIEILVQLNRISLLIGTQTFNNMVEQA